MRAFQPRWMGPIVNGRLMMFLGVLLVSAPVSQAAIRGLPSAGTILDRAVEATGGKQAHLSIKTRKMTGKLAVSQAGHSFEAKVEKHLEAPNNSHLVIDGSTFYQVSANNSNDAWEWRPHFSHGSADPDGSEETPIGTASARLLMDPKKAQVIEASQFHASVEWRDHYKKVETLGVADVEGRPAYEVQVTTKRGDQYSRFYDQENGRLVRTVRTIESSFMGKINMETLFEEYQEFDGVWLPTRVRQSLDSQEYGAGTQIWTYTKIQHDVKISPSLFEVPDELKS